MVIIGLLTLWDSNKSFYFSDENNVRVEGECFYFFWFYTFICVPLSSLFLSFISSSISSVSFFSLSLETIQNNPQGLTCR